MLNCHVNDVMLMIKRRLQYGRYVNGILHTLNDLFTGVVAGHNAFFFLIFGWCHPNIKKEKSGLAMPDYYAYHIIIIIIIIKITG